jgi:hypothetical protein
VAAALAVIDHGQLHARSSAGLLCRQHGLLVALPHLGGHHVEDALPDLAQLAGVVPGSELQKHLLRQATRLRLDVRGERVDRLDDHARLLRAKLP